MEHSQTPSQLARSTWTDHALESARSRHIASRPGREIPQHPIDRSESPVLCDGEENGLSDARPIAGVHTDARDARVDLKNEGRHPSAGPVSTIRCSESYTNSTPRARPVVRSFIVAVTRSSLLVELEELDTKARFAGRPRVARREPEAKRRGKAALRQVWKTRAASRAPIRACASAPAVSSRGNRCRAFRSSRGHTAFAWADGPLGCGGCLLVENESREPVTSHSISIALPSGGAPILRRQAPQGSAGAPSRGPGPTSRHRARPPLPGNCPRSRTGPAAQGRRREVIGHQVAGSRTATTGIPCSRPPAPAGRDIRRE